MRTMCLWHIMCSINLHMITHPSAQWCFNKLFLKQKAYKTAKQFSALEVIQKYKIRVLNVKLTFN